MSDDRRGRRIHQRFDCDLPVSLHVELDGEPKAFETRALNISLGGMFLADEARVVPFGAEGLVRFHLPKLTDAVEIRATVRWTTPEGIGVQFGSLRAKEVWGLNELFGSLRQHA